MIDRRPPMANPGVSWPATFRRRDRSTPQGTRADSTPIDNGGGASRNPGVTRVDDEGRARYLIDLTAQIEAIRAGLRAEIIAELRAGRDGSAWPEWMSASTAAAYLDISLERLWKLKARRAIPYYQAGAGCRVHFRQADLDGWMNGFKTEPAAPLAAPTERSTAS